MRKYSLVVLSFLVLSLIPSSALAQESNVTTIAETTTTPPKAARTAAKEEMKASLTAAKDEFKEKMTTAREAFKAKMASIKDKRKSNILSNFDNKINEINKRRTTQMTERVTRLTAILDRISTKEAALKAEGKNTTALSSDIASAKVAIDTAKAAIGAQLAKDYVVAITTETALRTSASAMIKQFIADLKVVHEAIVSAQQAVRKAHITLVQLNGGGATTTTPTVTTTP